MWSLLPLEEEPGEAPGCAGGHIPLVGDGHPLPLLQSCTPPPTRRISTSLFAPYSLPVIEEEG